MSEHTVDVAVIGGGPAGIATALSLGGGVSVLVAEASGYDTVRIGETLPGAAFVPLQELGLWESFLADGHLRSPGFISAWAEAAPGHLDLIADPFGQAWHLDRRRFDRRIAQEARARGVTVLERHRLTNAVWAQGGWRLTLAGPDGAVQVAARLAVDATGRPARLARRLGARRQATDRLVAATVLSEGALPDRLTRIEAARSGWWYQAGLPGGEIMTAFFTDTDIAHCLGVHRFGPWQRALAETGLAHMPGIVDRDPASGSGRELRVRVHPAQTSLLNPAQGADWIAVGDAAMARDPLSSQGILAALQSGVAAGSWLKARLAGDTPPSRQLALETAFTQFRAEQGRYYAMVQRWPDAPFWQRRVIPQSRSTVAR